MSANNANTGDTDLNLIEVHNLAVSYRTTYGTVHAVRDASLSLQQGEILGLVGESGSGKSVLCRSMLGLVEREGGTITAGSIELQGLSVSDKSEDFFARNVRGKRISLVFQDPLQSLNPVFTIGDQLRETLRSHRSLTQREATAAALKLLSDVRIADPAARLKAYPHELSGGMRQRVAIALALATDPEVLLADEPTTALDVTVQAHVLQLLVELQRSRDAGMVLVTHDLGIVAASCDRVAVMYGGYVVEEGEVEEIFDRPRHPYSAALLKLLVPSSGEGEERRMSVIPGQPPSTGEVSRGCPFASRCGNALDKCETEMPEIEREGRHWWRCWNPV